ncbi:nucleotidyltransferase family protein [Marinobacteraceae bacterium S3BR75-40.1]
MKAMILAAGKGERMRPLTLTTPKPLLQAGGKALIDYHLERLARAGFQDLVINHAWLGEQVEQHVETHTPAGLGIQYSREGEPLETAGGLRKALPLLTEGGDWFALVNGDVWTDFDFARLTPPASGDALLVLIDNPSHNQQGDFGLAADGRVTVAGDTHYTYAGIALIHRHLIEAAPPTEDRLGPILKAAAAEGRVWGLIHPGAWIDVGTPDRLQALDRQLSEQKKESNIR